MKKEINPITIWKNGKDEIAKSIFIELINDNLINTASFKYSLADDLEFNLANGILTLEGQDYKNWDGGNDYVFSWISQKLLIVFL
jgi:hypothetical protein